MLPFKVLCVYLTVVASGQRALFALLIIVPGLLCSYHDYWRFVTQRLSFLVSLLVYLESGRLATRVEVAHLLGSESKEMKQWG